VSAAQSKTRYAYRITNIRQQVKQLEEFVTFITINVCPHLLNQMHAHYSDTETDFFPGLGSFD